ncbi:MAG: PLDc N-terminal domain-containing protein [Candidatus Woesearchaeota archaeon]|nr:PLDc N-terminal domain-containing protein [Candidatus Woesearchaeota archaeon]
MAAETAMWMGIFISLLFLIFMAIFILAFIFWIFMIIDCAKRTFKDETEKIVWILVLVLVGLIGAIIYYFVVKAKDKK